MQQQFAACLGIAAGATGDGERRITRLIEWAFNVQLATIQSQRPGAPSCTGRGGPHVGAVASAHLGLVGGVKSLVRKAEHIAHRVSRRLHIRDHIRRGALDYGQRGLGGGGAQAAASNAIKNRTATVTLLILHSPLD